MAFDETHFSISFMTFIREEHIEFLLPLIVRQSADAPTLAFEAGEVQFAVNGKDGGGPAVEE